MIFVYYFIFSEDSANAQTDISGISRHAQIYIMSNKSKGTTLILKRSFIRVLYICTSPGSCIKIICLTANSSDACAIQEDLVYIILSLFSFSEESEDDKDEAGKMRLEVLFTWVYT